MKKRTLTILIAVVLVVACAVGGTLAWLTDKTDPVVNTFTAGDINIDLTETTTVYKMVPGNDISKNPKVTVKAGSEACWLFVKVDKSTDLAFDNYLTYTIADGWALVPSTNNVYYREVSATSNDTVFGVLKDDKVTVKNTVTKDMLDELNGNNNPTLTFTAYAVQKDNIATVASAWEEASKLDNTKVHIGTVASENAEYSN